MIRLWKTITASPVLRVIILSLLLSSIGYLILWDYSRVDRDFRQLKALLADVRREAIGQEKILACRFSGKAISIVDGNTTMVIKAYCPLWIR